VSDLCPAAFVVEYLAGGRISVAGRQPDVATANLAKLRRARLQQGTLQLVELVIAAEFEMEIDGAGRVVHVPIMTSLVHEPDTLWA
jgi:hypothetical protein